MGFVEDIANAIINGLEATVFKLLYELVIRPMSQFVAGLIGFLQDVIVGTPYPRVSDTSTVPAVLDAPGNQPWEFLYQLHQDIFQPYAYLLLFIILLTAIFLETFSGVLGDSATGKVSKVKKNFFQAFLMVTFWWYLGTLILATSDALTRLLMSAVSGPDPDSIGLVAVWEAVTQEITGDNIQNVGGEGQASDSAPVSTVLMIPLILLWLIEAIILTIIAILWVLRMFVIFVLMPVMPIFIAFYAMHLPGFDKIQSLGTTALKWFVSLAFVTLPAAIVIAVSGRIIDDVLSFGTDVLLPDSGSIEGPGPVEALNSYDTQHVIAHPQVAETVYGDGVAGLGAGQGQVVSIIAGLGAILFAIVLVIVIPILAGLAPLILYRSEAVELGQGAVNPAAGVMNEVGKARDKAKSVKSGASAIRSGDTSDLDYKGDSLRDAWTGDNLKDNLANNQAALFGLTGAKGAKETQKRATQMRSGAQTASARTRSGLAKADEIQMMARANPGQMSDVVRQNVREGAKKVVDPEKQRARATALAQKPSDAAEAVGSFADQVAEQKNSIDSRLEDRRQQRQRYEDMTGIEYEQRLGTQAYTPDADTIDAVAANDPTLLDSGRKNEMLSELDQAKAIGAQSPQKAYSALQMMNQSITDGLEGTDYDAGPHKEFLNELSDRVEKGEITPEEAMELADEVVISRLDEQVNTEQDVKDRVQHMEDMYERFGANVDSPEEVQFGSLSEQEINNMPELAEVIGGYGIRKNRLKKALKEDGLDPSEFDLDAMQENPSLLLDRLDKDTFNELAVSDKFEAKRAVHEEGIEVDTNFTKSEINKHNADELWESIENERNSDLNLDKAREFYKKDRVEISDRDSNQFVQDMLSEFGSDSDVVNDAKLEQELFDPLKEMSADEIKETWAGEDLASDFERAESQEDIDEAVESFKSVIQMSDASSLEDTEYAEQVEQLAKTMAKAKGEAHGKDLQHVEDMKANAFTGALQAKEEYRDQVVREMVNNAPSKEAALNMLSSQRGALVEAAGADPTESHSQAEREEILETLIEQELSGEEIQTAISERFHEEFESTQEMLENVDEIQQTRNIVKDVSENIDMEEVTAAYEDGLETAKDDIDTAKKLENLDVDSNMTLEEFKEEFGTDIGDEIDFSSVDGRSDTQTLEQLGVDSDDIVRTQIDEAKETRFNNAKEKIEEKFGVTPDEVGIEELDTNNLEEFAQKAAKKKVAQELDEELEKKKAEAKTE